VSNFYLSVLAVFHGRSRWCSFSWPKPVVPHPHLLAYLHYRHILFVIRYALRRSFTRTPASLQFFMAEAGGAAPTFINVYSLSSYIICYSLRAPAFIRYAIPAFIRVFAFDGQVISTCHVCIIRSINFIQYIDVC